MSGNGLKNRLDSPPKTADALLELFSTSRSRSRAHLRYPMDGPNEVEQAFNAAMRETFGPDEDYERSVHRLRRLGLINGRQE